MEGDVDALVDELVTDAAGDLQLALRYDHGEYAVDFCRDDSATADPEWFDDLHESLVLDNIGSSYLEDVYEAGPHVCTVHRFEDTTVLHLPASNFEGLFVSFESGADLTAAVETCTAWSADGRP